MHHKHLAMTALLGALLAASATGLAQDRHHGDDRRGDDRRDDRYSQRDDRRDHDRRDDGRWDGRDNHRFDDRPARGWHRGDHLPPQYRSRQYVVDDWRDHHLRPPPRGYHWVQNGSDYVLVAIASGVIADILLNH